MLAKYFRSCIFAFKKEKNGHSFKDKYSDSLMFEWFILKTWFLIISLPLYSFSLHKRIIFKWVVLWATINLKNLIYSRPSQQWAFLIACITFSFSLFWLFPFMLLETKQWSANRPPFPNPFTQQALIDRKRQAEAHYSRSYSWQSL